MNLWYNTQILIVVEGRLDISAVVTFFEIAIILCMQIEFVSNLARVKVVYHSERESEMVYLVRPVNGIPYGHNDFYVQN